MWNFGDLLDIVAAAAAPRAPAFIHDGVATPWPVAKQRMDALARGMIAHGASAGDKVAFYMRNGAAYGEMTGACFLASLTHANINYRFNANEVYYIADNADAAVLVYGAEFQPVVEEIRHRLHKVKLYIQVGAEPAPAFAVSYESLAADLSSSTALPPRSPENQVMAYTGGTTGMPKGVVFRQGELAPYLWRIANIFGPDMPGSAEEIAALIASQGEAGKRYLIACPQMHSTGFWVTMWSLLTGSCLVTVTSKSLEPELIWRTVERDRATNLTIVGDPFARPLLAVLDAAPGRFDLSCLTGIGSSGAMWSADVKRRLLRHLPQAVLFDAMSSTESMGVAVAVTTNEGPAQTAGFTPSPDTIVIDENDIPLPPGSGLIGRLAVGGMQPIGYYKDPEKTAKTFRVINGVRYSIPGDYAMLEADGAIKLLGRGSNCINTAGEKVYPEEVEEALKTHPSVEDALVIGMPDPQWGQAVTGIIRLAMDAAFDEATLRAHVRQNLAGYKVPKRILVTADSMRGPNGKADYKRVAAFAARELTQDAHV
jgi:acyl-CoA synthetase (AMP-forming)/AMP-acid ligase II